MHTWLALLLVVIAGVINGSFALFAKRVPKWRFENIWLVYSIWCFLLIPWITMFIMAPNVLSIYALIPMHLLWIMIIGGFLFGIGMICFAFAMNIVGMGLSFLMNIGIGTALGFLLPLVFQHTSELATPFGAVTLIGVVIIVLGLWLSYRAGQVRDGAQSQQHGKAFALGIVLGMIAGLFSAGENMAFSLTVPMQHIALQHGLSPLASANIMWPGFLVFTFIPYVIYMLVLHQKNHSWSYLLKPGTGHYHVYPIIMGLFWYGSLIFYSKASQLIGTLGPVIGWPLFMVLIILTSNFWGWQQGEWQQAPVGAKRTLRWGLVLFVLAVIVLGYSAHLS